MKIKKNGKVIRLTESDLQRIVKRVLTENAKLKDVAVGQVVIKNSEYDEPTNELSFKLHNDVKYFEQNGRMVFNSTRNVIEPAGGNILGIFSNKLPSTILLVTLKVTEIDGEDYGVGSKEMRRFKINNESDITLSLDKEGSPEGTNFESLKKNMGEIKDNIWFNLSDDL